MTIDTPRKQAIRENLANKFAKDWQFDFSTGPTIHLKSKSVFKRIRDLLFGGKHTVFAMYWFLKYEYHNNQMLQKFTFPIKHDNMPVQGIPMKYELQGTWRIREDDLKYLYRGPLLDQHGDILVPAETGLKKVQRIAQISAPFIVILSAIVGIAVKFPSLLILIK